MPYKDPEARRAWAKSYQKTWRPINDKRIRTAVFEQYGFKCNRCGFSDPRALQVDHKNGGGRQEYLTIGSRGVMKRALAFPDEYQLLCANCNWIKMAEEKENEDKLR